MQNIRQKNVKMEKAQQNMRKAHANGAVCAAFSLAAVVSVVSFFNSFDTDSDRQGNLAVNMKSYGAFSFLGALGTPVLAGVFGYRAHRRRERAENHLDGSLELTYSDEMLRKQDVWDAFNDHFRAKRLTQNQVDKYFPEAQAKLKQIYLDSNTATVDAKELVDVIVALPKYIKAEQQDIVAPEIGNS